MRSPSRMLSFVDSTIAQFITDGGANWGLYGNPDSIYTNGTWNVPGSSYNYAIRHPNNSTNISFLVGHVQNVPNSDDGAGNLTLRAALGDGVFVIRTTD